jgi:ClpP class serine protease
MVTEEDKKQAITLFGRNIEQPQIYKIEGENAIIKIKGPLSRSGPDFIDLFLGYGGTSYSDIINASEEILKNDLVKKVILEMDTPGGEATGVFETAEAISNLASNKKVIAMNLGSVASAGYWIASQARQIYASNPLAETGSIGVVWVLRDYDRNVKDDEYGYARVRIVSQNAKNKRPDITKPSERKWMQDLIDGIENLFISSVASGRKISKETIIEDFGNGAMFLAQDNRPEAVDAVKIDMIDGIVNYKEANFDESFFEDDDFKNLFNYTDRQEKEVSDNNDAFQELPRVGQEQNPAAKQRDNNIKEVLTMPTLKELLAENPAAKAEYDKELADYGKAQFEAGKQEIRDIVTKAAPFIGNSEYPKQITEAAVAVIKGERSVDVLDTMVSTADMIKELKNSNAATGETPEDTHEDGNPSGQLSEEYVKNGVIMTEADMAAEEKRMKRITGQEVN